MNCFRYILIAMLCVLTCPLSAKRLQVHVDSICLTKDIHPEGCDMLWTQTPVLCNGRFYMEIVFRRQDGNKELVSRVVSFSLHDHQTLTLPPLPVNDGRLQVSGDSLLYLLTDLQSMNPIPNYNAFYYDARHSRWLGVCHDENNILYEDRQTRMETVSQTETLHSPQPGYADGYYGQTVSRTYTRIVHKVSGDSYLSRVVGYRYLKAGNKYLIVNSHGVWQLPVIKSHLGYVEPIIEPMQVCSVQHEYSMPGIIAKADTIIREVAMVGRKLCVVLECNNCLNLAKVKKGHFCHLCVIAKDVHTTIPSHAGGCIIGIKQHIGRQGFVYIDKKNVNVVWIV